VTGVTLQIKTPRWALPFLKPARYKAAYGGRGSGKSHFFAELLVERCMMAKTRAVCIREVQNSLRESVRQLIVDKIMALGLSDHFEVLEAEIRAPHGGLIIFRGMQAYNAETIKSLEGYDIAFIEEAQTLSATSLRMLRPTIRAPGSEIWAAWNPRNDTDPIDNFFRGDAPPSNSVIERVNWSENPFFPDELRQEMEDDRKRDPEMASHVWDGGYEIVTEGAYYAVLLAQAEAEERIGDFPYDPTLPVNTAWDIGVDDYTAIWFFQENGKQVRFIDYYEASGEGVESIVQQALPELVPPDQRMSDRTLVYRYGRHYLPHDVRVREWGAGRSRITTLQEFGVKPINIGVANGPPERINASRALLPMCYFNKATTNVGIKRLRGYSRRFNKSMETFSGPLHDSNSHGADAFGEAALNCRLTIARKPELALNPKDRYTRAKQPEGVSPWG